MTLRILEMNSRQLPSLCTSFMESSVHCGFSCFDVLSIQYVNSVISTRNTGSRENTEEKKGYGSGKPLFAALYNFIRNNYLALVAIHKQRREEGGSQPLPVLPPTCQNKIPPQCQGGQNHRQGMRERRVAVPPIVPAD